MLTKKQLHNEIYYDRNTGEFFRVNTNRCSFYNDPIGSVTPAGYIIISVSGYKVMAHHLVMLYEYGITTSNAIDHVDGDPSNNKKENLRIVTHQENMKNKALNKNNKTGICGAQLIGGIYYLFVGGKYIGSSKSKKEISRLSEDSLIKNGYHKNHGKRKPTDVSKIKSEIHKRKVVCASGGYERADHLNDIRIIRSKTKGKS